MPLPSLQSHLFFYRQQHRTLGCRLTHLIGVPMILLAIPMSLINFRKALRLFAFGWVLQFIGHLVFEHNRPILLSRHRHPLTVVSSLIFVLQEWIFTARSVIREIRAVRRRIGR